MKRFLTCLAASLSSSSFLLAQLPTPAVQNLPPVATEMIGKPDPTPMSPPPFGLPVSVPTESPAASVMDGASCPQGCSSPRLWGSADYMLWWIQRGPLPVPLVTTNGNPAAIGAVNEPGTSVLLGQGSATNRMNYGTIPGLRATVGGWINDQHTIGLEGSGFILQDRSVAYPYATAGGNNPIIGLPFHVVGPFIGLPTGEEALSGGGFSNAVLVSSQTQLWGAEINGVGRLLSRPYGYLDVLAGFRYLDLRENLNIVDTFPDITTAGALTTQDSFTTRNQFYGGQLGLRTGLQWHRLTLDATAKMALGSTHEVVDVMGSTTVPNGIIGFPNGVASGGIYALGTNSGQHKHDEFSVVPEAQGRIGFNVTNHVKLYAGYTFLYATDWVRPGSQIDRNLNPSQIPLLAGPGAPLIGTAAPLPLISHGDFFAHGVNFGLEFKY